MIDNLSSAIDHTCLKPTTTYRDIGQLCREAELWQFASVCVNPMYVSAASMYLYGLPVKVCTVIGFPLGANILESKITETAQAIHCGASEIDLVMNIGHFKSGRYDQVVKEIQTIVNLARGGIVKVIIETALLDDDEILTACELVRQGGANFVKTSTGMSSRGASIRDMLLMKKAIGGKLEIKASGGIKTLAQAINMINAGATRIGTSSGVQIMKELEAHH